MRFMARFPGLKIVGNFGVGYDSVDVAAAAKRGVVVTNTPDVLTEEVADTTLGLLLGTVREFYQAEKWLRDGRWAKEGDYRLTGASLRDRSVGIVGLGRIGKAIARRCEAFGLPVSYFGRSKQADVSYRYYSDLVAMARDVDTLIVVTPGGPGTAKLINAAVLQALGPRGILINVSRGSVVDEDGADRGAEEPHHHGRRPRRVHGRAQDQSGVPDARQRHAAAARRLGVGAHARRHGPAGGRQPGRLRRSASRPRRRCRRRRSRAGER